MSMLLLEQLEQAPILDKIDATFDSGRVVGLIGPNGSGKSTLLRTIAGLLPATAGKVCVNGQDITHLPSKMRARSISYLPQAMPFDIPFTVREFVEMGRYSYDASWFYKTDDSEVNAALQNLGLTAIADVPLTEISGGERQRAGIAKCLAQNSPVLLLDEPISNLDVYYQLDIMERLAELALGGRLIILAIHHLEFAIRFCHELLVLANGRVYQRGPVESVASSDMIRDVFGIEAQMFSDPILQHPRLSISRHGMSHKNIIESHRVVSFK